LENKAMNEFWDGFWIGVTLTLVLNVCGTLFVLWFVNGASESLDEHEEEAVGLLLDVLVTHYDIGD